MTRRVKYIAKGFLEDSGRLLNDFVEKNSIDFSDFAEIWRKHHFSLIYMGRPDETELTEFTNEIFRVSCQFLSTPSFYQKVGAVFLLYSLYQTQISNPEIKIRIEMSHWKIINALRTDAISSKRFSLLYVIDFLIENALVFVASQILRGPLVGSIQKESKNLEAITNLKATYKSDIHEFSASNPYQELKELHTEYLEMKKQLGGDMKISLNDPSEEYEEFDRELQDLVNPGPSTSRQVSASLGTRRAKIKAESFTRKAFDRFGQEMEGDDCNSVQKKLNEDNVGSPKKTRIRSKPRRTPKELRKVGRPRKHNIEAEKPAESEPEDEVDISYLFSQQENLYLPPEETADSIKRKTKRDAYYKLSPKREAFSSSSSDIDEG